MTEASHVPQRFSMEKNGSKLGDQGRLHLNGSGRRGRVLTSGARDSREWGRRAPTGRKQQEQRQRTGKGAAYVSFIHSTNIDGIPRVPESRTHGEAGFYLNGASSLERSYDTSWGANKQMEQCAVQPGKNEGLGRGLRSPLPVSPTKSCSLSPASSDRVSGSALDSPQMCPCPLRSPNAVLSSPNLFAVVRPPFAHIP